MTEKIRDLKVESVLPVKTVGIECLKESNPEKMSPHRYIFKWFARRPTAATRLAVLSSVLPQDVSNDKLLEMMQIGPENPERLDGSISDYVFEKWQTKSSRSGSVSDHYGYPTPHSVSPNQTELDEIHSILRDHWDGQLPTVIDPTAGGGTIPLESLRYGLPTVSNELNPVAWLLNEVMLNHAKNVGSVKNELREWANEINKSAKGNLDSYFPSANPGQVPNHYLRSYSIQCPSCGYRIPLVTRWWIKKKSANEGHAIRPHVKQDTIEYEHITNPDASSGFDPNEGTIQSGEAECLNCEIVVEKEDVKERFAEGEFEYEVCGLQYIDERTGSSGYRAANERDKRAIREAEEKINSDLRLSTLLSTTRDVGDPDNLRVSWSYAYGMEEWRDIYSPRQLLSHAAYLQAFEDVKPAILEEYNESKAQAILTIISLSTIKLIERNSRLEPLDIRRGSPANMLGSNNLAFQWGFGESNLTVGSYSFNSTLEVVLKKYELLSEHLSEVRDQDVVVRNGDAADLPFDDNSLEAVVVDPPYGDNIRYAELADAFYVWIREYLGDIYPDELQAPLTDKSEEAIEDRSRVRKTGDSDQSKGDLARERYESKMSDIFSEVQRVMSPGGVLTVYFTEKETNAWDSLTMSMINAGMTVTATHTVTSEMPQRVGMQQKASADSTLLLTCRKPLDSTVNKESEPTLWSDIRGKTREVARNKATELLDSDMNLTKTDMIISAFGPTLRVFTESYPVVDKHDNTVRPQEALEEARTAVTEVLVERELEGGLDEVDSLTTWYILCWLVYGRSSIPYDEANQLGLGVGVQIDDLKRDTKIWGKSGDELVLKDQNNRVRDYTALEAGEKRRKRAYPIDPRDNSFSYDIDMVHATLNIMDTKGSEFTWNWLKERNVQNNTSFKETVKSLLQVLPEDNDDYLGLINLVSGDTGELLDIDLDEVIENSENSDSSSRTTLQDY